jgi:hypothetical protein
MRIKWSNVVAMALAIFGLLLGIKLAGPMSEFLSNLGTIGGTHNRQQQFLGMMAFGLVLVTIVAIVRILQNNRSE